MEAKFDSSGGEWSGEGRGVRDPSNGAGPVSWGGPGNSQGVWRGRRIRVQASSGRERANPAKAGDGVQSPRSCSRRWALRSPSVECRWGLFPQSPWCQLT